MATFARRNGFVISGYILLLISLFLTLLSFATPYWIEPFDLTSFGRSRPPTQDLDFVGLWIFGFHRFFISVGEGQDYGRLGKTYTGAQYIFYHDLEYIRPHLQPPWFQGVQVCVSFALLIQGLYVMLIGMYLCLCCNQKRDANFLLSATVLILVSGYLCAAASIIFGISWDENKWQIVLKDSKLYHLSWSWGLCAVSGAFALFSGLLFGLAMLRAQSNNRAREPKYNMSLAMANLSTKT